MKIKLYNTPGRKIEEFRPLKPGFVGFYTCGPTVYDYAHLGHARTYVFADLLKRMFLYNGYEVKQVMNITDVGHLSEADIFDEGQDKIEMAAKKEKKSAWEIAEFYTDDFFQLLEELNILKPAVICKATDHIQEQIELIKRIEKKGLAYVIKRGVCFDTAKFPAYADFARLDLQEMKEGARVERDPQKKNPADFWLWRFSDPREERQMEWDSPWGRGFPGWHIECSAMSMKYLGEKFDLHTGGVDHIRVHHTNEVAQNWATTGHKVVNFWLHGAFLLIEGQKMAKSLKNFYRVADIKEKGFEPLALRYLFLTSHYRAEMNFTWQSLAAAAKALAKLRGTVRELKEKQKQRSSLSRENLKAVEVYRAKFLDAINYDLKLPEALAIVWEVARAGFAAYDKLDLLLDFDQVLGLGLGEVSEVKEIPLAVKKLVQRREELRKEERWLEADEVRKTVEKLGWQIEDTVGGPRTKRDGY